MWTWAAVTMIQLEPLPDTHLQLVLSPPAPGTIEVLPVSIDLPFLEISY